LGKCPVPITFQFEWKQIFRVTDSGFANIVALEQKQTFCDEHGAFKLNHKYKCKKALISFDSALAHRDLRDLAKT
jgi:hypothetical protein